MTDKFVSRPPIVTLMGHIDHGKTSLLDKIRQSHQLEKEAGGITQATGAYQASFLGKKITFIDTPGHKTFAKMRARGVKITDLVVLVIAADEGVMPQTEESWQYIKEAKVPFLIALNKIDLPQAQQEKVLNQLAKLGILVEKMGGDVVLVPVSAKTGEGINTLLEMILLLAEMNEVRVERDASFEGVVVESAVDRRRGAEATVIVQKGKLKVGDDVIGDGREVRIRAMVNDQGQPCQEATISQPVLVLGFSTPPPVGSKIYLKKEGGKRVKAKNDVGEGDKGGKKLVKDFFGLVFKADTLGAKEAILDALPQENLIVLQSGVGDINESDVLLASSFGAKIFGFNVRVGSAILDLAKHEEVDIKIFKIIYEFLEEVEKEVAEFRQRKEEKEILGMAEIIAIFDVAGQKVVGGRVQKGGISLGATAQIWRQDRLLGEIKISSLRQGKKNIGSVRKGGEFGAIFSPHLDFLVGDVIRLIKSDSNNSQD